jgi:hypothetical protein
MRGRYFRDLSIVRADEGEKTCPTPEENEVVIFRSFFKAGLRFPLSSFVVEVLKIFEICLHQITPEAIIRMGIFVWAVKSQGLEPNAKSFCNIHELLYETKPWGKEQYHNNFGCYSFGARSGSSCPVPTFRKRWPGDWMKEWFYVKNDLKAREDIKDIIMRPIWHIAFRVWPLVEKWEMPKETITKSDEGGLVRLKYTFRYEGKFVEPDDDWLKCIEATSDELIGPYSKAEDIALSAAFGGRKKKRLNRVFDAIGFVYPDYRYPLRGQKRKGVAPMKDIASAAPSESALKRKKMKVLTHRPRFIETATVPGFGGEASSANKAKETALMQKTEGLATTPKVPLVKLGEPEVKKTKLSEITSPSAEVSVPKAQKDLAITPKRKRMVHVLDVLEEIKISSSTSGKIAEASKTQVDINQIEAEAVESHAEPEAGPSEPAKKKSLEKETKKDTSEQLLSEQTGAPIPEAYSEASDYILRHASGKKLTEKEKQEAQFYAQKLKYPKGR